MAYQDNIPLASDALSKSQADIQANFQALSPFGNGYGIFSLQGAAPTVSVGDTALYTYLNAITSKNELNIVTNQFAGVKTYPMTASILSTATPITLANGWTQLASGILIYWMTFTGTGLTTVTLPTGGLPYTQIMNVMVSPYSSSTSDADFAVRFVDILSTTQFRVYISARSTTGAAAGGGSAIIIGY